METCNKKYSLGNNCGAITETICSIVIILLLFFNWIAEYREFGDRMPTPYEIITEGGQSTPYPYIFFTITIGNIVLKFFRRSVWLSAFLVFFIGNLIWMNNEVIKQFNDDPLIDIKASFSVWGYLAILLEIILIVSVLTGIINALINCSRKKAKRLLIAALIGLVAMILGLVVMGKGGNAIIGVPLISGGSLVFLICGLIGTIGWFAGKKDDNEQTNTADSEINNETTDNNSVSEKVNNVMSTEEDSVYEDSDGESKKWYYICGAAIAVLTVFLTLFTCIGFKKSSGEFAGKAISELFPVVSKAIDSGKIPDSPAVYEWDISQGDECGGGATVVRKAGENQMVIMYETNSCDANILRLGVYQNGQYVFYYELPVGNLDYDETKKGIFLHTESPESAIYYGYYGKDVVDSIKYDWGTDYPLDWNKVREVQLAELFQNALNEGPKSSPYILTYNDIKANMSGAAISENINITDLTGFSYVVEGVYNSDAGHNEYRLEVQTPSGDRVNTEIANYAYELSILAQDDFDGDGEKEALVYEWGGGNTILPPYIVYYDKEGELFKKVDGFDYVSEDPEIKIEQWKEMSSFVIAVGLRKDRYVYENHSVRLVESITPDLGERIATISLSQLFKEKGGDMDRSIYIDIDGDGSTEELTFHHDDSHALNWGNSMSLIKIEADNWSIPENENESLDVIGNLFNFLVTKNDGIPDLLCDNAWLYRWNGKKYEKCELDGNELMNEKDSEIAMITKRIDDFELGIKWCNEYLDDCLKSKAWPGNRFYVETEEDMESLEQLEEKMSATDLARFNELKESFNKMHKRLNDVMAEVTKTE